MSYATGRWPVGLDDFDRTPSFGLLLIDGLLAREAIAVALLGRPPVELQFVHQRSRESKNAGRRRRAGA